MNPSAALPEYELPEHHAAEVLASGLDPSTYRVVRLSGATHDEVMEAFVLGADLEAYTLFRSSHSHRRALDEAGTPNSPTHLEAGRLGVTDHELDEVRATHRATVEAFWARLRSDGRRPDHEIPVTRVGDYLTARRAGLAHPGALRFAQRVSALAYRPDSRDLLQWARCLAAGLEHNRLFAVSPRTQRPLIGYELEVLHALLFAVRSFETNPLDWEEMEWAATKAAGHRHPFKVHAYLDARLRKQSRRVAMRWATRPF
jgi:hypothetical protein